jgi:hypothetical protein
MEKVYSRFVNDGKKSAILYFSIPQEVSPTVQTFFNQKLFDIRLSTMLIPNQLSMLEKFWR